jgi:hypothetical protein
MTRTYLAIAALAVLLASCALIGPAGSPAIRVANRSTLDFDRVLVNFSDQEVDYGALPAGTASEYRSPTVAYRYARIEVHVDTARLVLQPVDFVGETPLDGGSYTYALKVADDGRGLGLTLERDD